MKSKRMALLRQQWDTARQEGASIWDLTLDFLVFYHRTVDLDRFMDLTSALMDTRGAQIITLLSLERVGASRNTALGLDLANPELLKQWMFLLPRLTRICIHLLTDLEYACL